MSSVKRGRLAIPFKEPFGLRGAQAPSQDEGPSGERDLLLNGKRIFQHGVLYQPYWPESLVTPPSRAALEEDTGEIRSSLQPVENLYDILVC